MAEILSQEEVDDLMEKLIEKYRPVHTKKKSKKQPFIDWLDKTKNIVWELSSLFRDYQGYESFDIIALDESDFADEELNHEVYSACLSYKELEQLKEQNNNIITAMKKCLKELKKNYNKNKYESKINKGYVIYEDPAKFKIIHCNSLILNIIDSCASIKRYIEKEATRMNKNKKNLPKEEIQRITQLVKELGEIKNSYDEFRHYIYEDFNSLISVNNDNVPTGKQKLPYMKFRKWDNIGLVYASNSLADQAVTDWLQDNMGLSCRNNLTNITTVLSDKKPKTIEESIKNKTKLN